MDKGNKDSLPIEADYERPIREVVERNKGRKKNKIKKKLAKSFKIYEYGKNPRRYLIGILYASLNMLLGMSSNPLTPIAVTISRVFYFYKFKGFQY